MEPLLKKHLCIAVAVLFIAIGIVLGAIYIGFFLPPHRVTRQESTHVAAGLVAQYSKSSGIDASQFSCIEVTRGYVNAPGLFWIGREERPAWFFTYVQKGKPNSKLYIWVDSRGYVNISGGG